MLYSIDRNDSVLACKNQAVILIDMRVNSLQCFWHMLIDQLGGDYPIVFTSELGPMPEKSIISQLIVTDKVVFGAIFSTCVI